MAIIPYLAMTAAEMAAAEVLPEKPGWMACHFSPYSTGLSNLPGKLPEGALLILNDRTPIHRHDPVRVAEQLLTIMEKQKCSALLLDFQQPVTKESADFTASLTQLLPCHLAVSSLYASEDFPVFLPPVPVDIPIENYIQPWKKGEIWLEIAINQCCICVDEKGAQITGAPVADKQIIHHDDNLHCHYYITETSSSVLFQLYRTPEDIHSLLQAAQALGIQYTVGLYQELRSITMS